MRPTRTIYLLALLLTYCAEKDQITLNETIDQLNDPPQIFEVDNNKTDTLTGKNGTLIIIQPNIFTKSDGSSIDGLIDIELVEVFDKSQMIINGISTTSNGRLLESIGMINLKAFSQNEELSLREGKGIIVQIPNKHNTIDGELFYGEENEGQFNWIYAGDNTDRTETIEVIMPMSGGLDSIRRTVYKYTDGTKRIVLDTGYIAPSSDRAGLEELINVPQYYQFEIKTLGWINCDRFINYENTSSFTIELEEFEDPIGYIVFSSINSVMQVHFNKKSIVKIDNLPVGYPISIVVLDKIKSELRWAKNELNIGTVDKIKINTKPINEQTLKDELKKLDN